MLRLPLLATFILLPFLLCAQESPLPQTRLVDLAKEYQLNAANGSEPVGTLFQGARAMEERFPSWVAHWQAAGRDLASLQQISLLACAWNDAVLKAGKQLYGPQAEPIEFLLPHGVFQVDFPLMLMPGTFRATGGATVLVVDPSDWAGAPGEALLHLAPWGTSAMAGRSLVVVGLTLEWGTPVNGMPTPHEGLRIDAPGGTVELEQLTVRGFSGTGIVMAGLEQSQAADLVLEGNGTGIALLGCTGDRHTFRNITGGDNGTRFRTGPWGAYASDCNLFGADISLAAGRYSDSPAGPDRLISSDGLVKARFERVQMHVGKVAPASLCLVRNSRTGSFISVQDLQVEGPLHRLVQDPTQGRSYFRTRPDDPESFGFCWDHDQTGNELSAQCGSSLFDQQRLPATGSGGAKSGEATTIGAPTGEILAHVDWGFNCSSLFSITAGTDTSLQHRINELAPGVLRFPGGTLANFTHPTGHGYGIRATDLVAVEGTEVHNTVLGMYEGEQAAISSGQISGNYLQDVIDVALATDQKVLFVANLFSGTVQELMTSLNTLVNAGVQLAGVELGNESHLRAYESRFGTHENYLAVAAPYAQAITNAYPGLKIGVNGYPPGVLKDLGPGGTQRAHDWNVAVSNASFGDALVIHCYSRPSNCTQPSVVPNFTCGADFSRIYAREKMDQALNELTALGDRSIWITEWNIDGDYSHYGNSLAQALFYADMAFTMAEHPRVTVSAVHNLLSMDAGYNVIRKIWPGFSPQINYHASRLMAPMMLPGNLAQPCALNAVDGLRAMAFLTPDQQTQHLYVINRSGTAMSLADFVGEASSVTVHTLGGDDLASGTGPNAARPNGSMGTNTQVVADIHGAQLPPYSIVHLSWAATPPEPTPLWASSFNGQDDCRLTATIGTDVVQTITGRCADVGGGKVITSSTSSFPSSLQAKRVVLEGVTFQSIQTGKWVNGRAKFMGTTGQIKDPSTGQLLATVQAGQYYPELVLDYSQPVTFTALIGKPNGGQGTAPMTIKGLRLYP
ncbi:MAG: hypothetical protein KBF80_10535 [Flavobacteriales bacterium]|nr:hypothetical protein [Flavobacteriales bacterium]